MNSEKKLRTYLVASSILILLLCATILSKNVEIEKNQKQILLLEKRVDSLKDDNFNLQLSLFKFQRAEQILKKEDSIIGSHFSDIITDETE